MRISSLTIEILIIFQVMDECPPDRGCSVLIKGADARELKAAKVKLVLSSCIGNIREAQLSSLD